MIMELNDVVNFANATKSLFDANPGVMTYNTDLEDTWEADIFIPQIAAVSGMIGTRVLISLNKGKTVLRDGYMDNEQDILTDLEFKIKLCITAATITDSLASFGLGAFRKSITNHDIGSFHIAYTNTMSRIAAGGNTAALEAKGFVAADIASITTNHDLAWNMNTAKITLKTQISSLSVADQALVKALLITCALVIASLKGLAAKTKNKDLKKKATAVALLSTVAPKKAPTPVDRNIPENASICWLQHPVARDLMQFTLLTEKGSAMVCRMNSKTGVCGAGIPLVYNEMITAKKMGVPGTGDCIVITNTGVGKIVVKTFRVKGGS
jgi:hypothetical protein